MNARAGGVGAVGKRGGVGDVDGIGGAGEVPVASAISSVPVELAGAAQRNNVGIGNGINNGEINIEGDFGSGRHVLQSRQTLRLEHDHPVAQEDPASITDRDGHVEAANGRPVRLYRFQIDVHFTPLERVDVHAGGELGGIAIRAQIFEAVT